MRAIIIPGSIKGTISAPPSKSMTQRAYAAAVLQKGTTNIYNAGVSKDEQAALGIIQQLGAQIVHTDANLLTVHSNGVTPVSNFIDCGESGLAARLFTPIAALSHELLTITGHGSLLQRPMEGFTELLPELGVTISDFNGYLPVTIRGPLNAKDFQMDAASGSQLLSGLLFALCQCANKLTIIEIDNITSKPYIDMTLDILGHFGMPVTHREYKTFYIDPSLFTHAYEKSISIEGDWSSAANLLVAGAIGGSVTVDNLSMASKQADMAILAVLADAGANINKGENTVTVSTGHLKAFEFDATHCPDLFPILSILAALSNGESYIKGVHRLFHKESNRTETISEMLMNFDVPFSLEDDCLCITGVRRLQGTVIDSCNDHRIAMAATVGALRAGGQVDIMQAGAVDKSYPDFYKHLSLCGMRYSSHS